MSAISEGLTRFGPQDYGEYLKHQAAKLPFEYGALLYYEPRYRMELAERLRMFGAVHPGMSVLCLAARLGAEVRAFIDCGCFAVGLDLNPGEGNKYVVHGDFQQIQFANDSVDVVFTNAVDHVFNLDIFIGEICRVLKADGLLIMDLIRGKAEGVQPEEYESLFWDTIDDILAPFLAGPFDLILRTDFQWPWPAQHIILKHRKK